MEWTKTVEPSQGGLKSYDFIPKCIKPDSVFHWPQFEKFSSLVGPVNEFLRQNPFLSVKSCETAHFRVEKDHLREPENSSFIQVGESLQPFVKGLRLWVFDRSSLSSAVQKSSHDEIGYITFVPQLNGEAANTLADLTTKVNEYLQTTPLPGRIISLESLQMRGVTEGDVDVDASSWKPTFSLASLQHGFLSLSRIWFVRGQPQYETVGMADFFPAKLEFPEALVYGHFKFQRIPEVMQSVDNWVSQLPSNISILNINTLSTRADRKGENINPYSTFLWGDSFHKKYLKFIRIAYVVSPQLSAPPGYERRHFTSKLFVPGLVREPTWIKSARFEPQTVIKERLDEWVRRSAVKVTAVETVLYKTKSGGEKHEGFDVMYTWNETNYNHNTKREEPASEQYLTCYRVYVEGDASDPPKFLWPPRSIEDYNREHAGDCAIL